MTVTVDCIDRGPAVLGEGPLWSPTDQSLYWVDIKSHRLHRRAADGTRRTWTAPALLSCVALARDGGLVGALDRSLCRLDLVGPGDDLRGEEIGRLPYQPPHIRFNDGKVAPDGALWVGTMDDEEQRADGAWWRFAADGGVTLMDTGYGVTNGPAFDAASGRGFVTDSARRTIYALDGWGADACAGKRPLRVFTEAEGYPDGMTLDADGRLWVAFWDGGCVRALDPVSGETITRVDLPASRPTSCAFGGAGLDVLYITSASVGLAPGERPEGGLFAVTGGSARGAPEPLFG